MWKPAVTGAGVGVFVGTGVFLLVGVRVGVAVKGLVGVGVLVAVGVGVGVPVTEGAETLKIRFIELFDRIGSISFPITPATTFKGMG